MCMCISDKQEEEHLAAWLPGWLPGCMAVSKTFLLLAVGKKAKSVCSISNQMGWERQRLGALSKASVSRQGNRVSHLAAPDVGCNKQTKSQRAFCLLFSSRSIWGNEASGSGTGVPNGERAVNVISMLARQWHQLHVLTSVRVYN